MMAGLMMVFLLIAVAYMLIVEQRIEQETERANQDKVEAEKREKILEQQNAQLLSKDEFIQEVVLKYDESEELLYERLLEEFKGDLLSHTSSGRLIRRAPDGTITVLLDDLDFANGVALAQDESFVLVAETGGYRVTRLDLAGPEAGRRSVIIDNLPGIPDNMSTGSDGVFWIAMPTARNRLLDLLLSRPGFLRSAVWSMPERLQPDVTRITWVVGIDGEGDVVHNLQASGKDFHYVTGVRERDGRLYLGSLVEPGVAIVDLASG